MKLTDLGRNNSIDNWYAIQILKVWRHLSVSIFWIRNVSKQSFNLEDLIKLTQGSVIWLRNWKSSNKMQKQCWPNINRSEYGRILTMTLRLQYWLFEVGMIKGNSNYCTQEVAIFESNLLFVGLFNVVTLLRLGR